MFVQLFCHIVETFSLLIERESERDRERDRERGRTTVDYLLYLLVLQCPSHITGSYNNSQ